MSDDHSLTQLGISALAVLTGGAAWVGRLQQRMNRHDDEIERLANQTSNHLEADVGFHETMARIDERTLNTERNVARLLNGGK